MLGKHQRISSRPNHSSRQSQNRQLDYQALESRQLLASFYVDNTGGSNTNDGLSLGSAFETIQAAANTVQAGDSVFIRGGTYRETVSVPQSGTSGNPIVFSAYNNEDVSLSGGDLVTGWTQYAGNIWSANVNYNAGNNRNNNTLFVDGELKLEAKQGAESDFFDINNWGELKQGRLVSFANSFRVDDLGGFADDYWNGAKITFHTHDYRLETRTITDFDSSSGLITLDSAVDVVSQKQDNGYFIHDTLDAVDKAGEWFKDTGNNLYYQVAAGQNPNNLDIEFKRRDYAFDVRGRDHITIDGLVFRGASIQTDSSTDSNLYQNSSFFGYDKGNFGRFYITGDDNTLRDNEFSDTWTSFVTVGGERNSIVNNYIHDIGYNATTRAISATAATELLFSHNTVNNFARSFMDGYPSQSEIAHNVFDNGGRLTWDTGVFDSDGSNGNSSNSVFHHNIFRNTDTHGIYEAFYGLNNNAVIHHNVIHDFNVNGSRTVLRASGTDFRQVFHNTVISGVNGAPAGELETSNTVQARYNNNVQITTARVESLGVDLRGNHNYATSDFVNFAGKDFRLASGSAAIDSGIVIPGINDNVTDGAPDAGAFEAGQVAWTAGHDFVNKPNPVLNSVALPGTNLYDNGQFLQGIGDWTIISGTPNSQDRNSWNLQASGASLTGNFRTQSVEFTPGEGIQQTFTGLSPNTTYTIGATARVANRVYSGNQFNGSSGSISTGTHRNEGYATGLSGSEWIRFDNIDFGDLGQFDQLDLLHIRNPGAGFPTVDGVSVQFRLDGPSGTLLGELTNLANGNIGDRWRANRTDFAAPVSGVHSIYVSVSGGNSQNLTLGSLRLLNSAPPTSDLLTVTAISVGAELAVAQIGNEDWYVGYDEISFTTGPNTTTAEISFENQGRLNAYLDRFYLLEGKTTRGGLPRGIGSTATAERSLTPTTSASADLVIDGLSNTLELTGNHAGSWIQVDLDEVAVIHSIKLTPLLSLPQLLSNIRVSVWNGNPQTGGVELWSQDYLTDGISLSLNKAQVIQADAYGRDGSTQLGDVSGRFVLVQTLGLNNAGNNVLAIAEIDIQLFDESNLAVTDGIASQSSTVSGQTAINAVDGNPLTLSSTESSATNSWWQTRLTNASSIGQIVLTNHDNNNFAELSNFTVSVWDEEPSTGGTKLWEKSYFASGSVARGGSLVIDGSETSDNSTLRLATVFTGRVVRVQLNGTNNAGNGRLSLAEVRVAPTHAAKPLANLAQGGVATQSADFYGDTATHEQIGYASTAIDGVIEPRRNFSTTPNESGSWWQVELQQASDLEQIVLVNRVDAANRLNNFTVSVWSDDPSNGGTQLWSRGYGYSGSAATYSTSSIGAGGALIIDGSSTSGGLRLDDVENAKYVRVQLGGSNFLSLVEVQVWGPAPAGPTIVDTSQTEFRYDLGTVESPVFDNTYSKITSAVTGDIEWTSPVVGVDYGPAAGQNALNRDGLQKSDGPSTFEHRIANGIWQVLVTVGDDASPLDQVNIAAEGQTFVSGITRSTGQYANEIFQVAVEDDSLSLTLSDGGGANSLWSASRIILSRVGDLPGAGTVEGRYVFYNNSFHDGNDADAAASDDGAIATNKSALLPGQTATFSNYTSYEKGINGVIVDIDNLANASALSAADFVLSTGNGSSLSDFSTLATAPLVSVRVGAGVNGSDRVSLILPDELVTGSWLSVTVLANANTDLPQNDVFYFGNAVGDTGNSTAHSQVTDNDEMGARNNPRNFLNRAGVEDLYDFNRDSLVTGSDEIAVRNNNTDSTDDLNLITAPSLAAPSAMASASLPLMASVVTQPDDFNRDSLMTESDEIETQNNTNFTDDLNLIAAPNLVTPPTVASASLPLMASVVTPPAVIQENTDTQQNSQPSLSASPPEATLAFAAPLQTDTSDNAQEPIFVAATTLNNTAIFTAEILPSKLEKDSKDGLTRKSLSDGGSEAVWYLAGSENKQSRDIQSEQNDQAFVEHDKVFEDQDAIFEVFPLSFVFGNEWFVEAWVREIGQH